MVAIEQLSFLLPDGTYLRCDVRLLLNAGYAGRDRSAVERHIRELQRLGVSAPAHVPCFYPISSYLALQASLLQVQHPHTSGEAEYVLLQVDGRSYVSVGSDHSDRLLERSSVALAKQACANILASQAWELSEVANHWDQLHLRSWTRIDGRWHLYQSGDLSQLWRPEDLLDRWLSLGHQRSDGLVLFSGTLPTIGGLKCGSAFRFELTDSVLDRSLGAEYEVEVLPPPVE